MTLNNWKLALIVLGTVLSLVLLLASALTSLENTATASLVSHGTIIWSDLPVAPIPSAQNLFPLIKDTLQLISCTITSVAGILKIIESILKRGKHRLMALKIKTI